MAKNLTATGAAAAAVTLTLPQTTTSKHRIYQLTVVMYTTAARTGTATPVVVTSTNLSGLALTFPSAGAVGTIERVVVDAPNGLDGDAINTATTIVCPATTAVIWRINAVFEDAG